MHVMSFIGSASFYVPVLAVVFWCLSPRAGAWAAVLLTMSGALNLMLKVVIHAPRPFWTDPSIAGREPLSSFGMPSGHAQGSAVAYGLFGARAARSVSARSVSGRAAGVWAGVGAVVVLVGVSRVYLGVHSAGQVVAGWLIAAGLLLGARTLGPVVTLWWRGRRLPVQLGLGLAISLAFLAPTAVAVRDLRGWRMPGAWARAIEAVGGTVTPVTLAGGAAVSGALFGVLAGLSWLARRGWFAADGTPWRRIARVPVGVAGTGVILLCGWLAGGGPAGGFVTCAAAAAWMTGGAPEAFVRLGLAKREHREVRPAGDLAGDGRF